jgi:ferrochelatase
MPSTHKLGVLFINFGEPDVPELDKVEPFLERIFLMNAGLEPDESARDRARQLAQDRAPGLIAEYQRIGGSPLNQQADAQAARLEGTLRERGWDVRAYSAFQFTAPLIREKLAEVRADGVDGLVAVPAYPLCGQSTTVAAIESIRAELVDMEWDPGLVAVSGWHHHPAYEALRAETIREFTEERAVDLTDPNTLLYFSAHGTPIKYLNDGNRYDRYVEEHCRAIAGRLGATRYAVGFQNHTNRRIPWTQPANEVRIREATESRLVVVPISFMHEQSETLVELDHELREFMEELGKELLRVPVPHDDERFDAFLADLVECLVDDGGAGSGGLSPCRCAPHGGVLCTNGARDLPQSPYAAVEGSPPVA